MVRIDSAGVIGDNMWLWRADHVEGGGPSPPWSPRTLLARPRLDSTLPRAHARPSLRNRSSTDHVCLSVHIARVQQRTPLALALALALRTAPRLVSNTSLLSFFSGLVKSGDNPCDNALVVTGDDVRPALQLRRAVPPPGQHPRRRCTRRGWSPTQSSRVPPLAPACRWRCTAWRPSTR